MGRNHKRTTISQCPIYGAVRWCTSLELLHQRDHYLYDALHRTNHAGQCQSRIAHRVRLLSMQDFEEMVPDVHELREICRAISKNKHLVTLFACPKRVASSAMQCCVTQILHQLPQPDHELPLNPSHSTEQVGSSGR